MYDEGARRTLLALKRPKGDISMRRAGEIPYRSPLPLLPASGEDEPNRAHPPKLSLTQLKNLILAGGFSVKVEIDEGVERALLTLKRPLGDINVWEGGEIHYWGLLVRSWKVTPCVCVCVVIARNSDLIMYMAKFSVEL